MSLEITEKWIIERIKLEHDNLDDVKSLSLPGTYHEKITGLGFSLQNFTRLQQLNLAKNHITSLKGLEHLTLLEQLNLYYNKIQDLKEIFRLRKNRNLRDIDLRLNPVTGNEPDYRLFIAHMLPLLRRLDDRPVRDSERKAALMHFSSNDATNMFSCDEDKEVDNAVTSKSRQPRVAYVKNIVQKPSVIQDDDTVTDVIDYVNKGMGKVENSVATRSSKPSSELHTQDDLVRIVRKQTEEEERKLLAGGAHRVAFAEEKPEDDHLRFQDEDSAYTQFHSLAHFTPHPGSNDIPPTVNPEPSAPILTNTMSSNAYKSLPERTKLSFGDSTGTEEDDKKKNLIQNKFVESFLDLVDRYWNGSKSLHYHQKFQSLIHKPLENFEKELATTKQVQIKVLHDKLSNQQREIDDLRNKLRSTSTKAPQTSKESEEHSKVHQELENTKSRLQLTISDNKILRGKIAQLESQLAESKEKEEAVDGERVIELEQQKKELVHQVAGLKRSTEQYEKISQLATMLQDSHRSLVSTNEHLLSELEDTRSRHQSEIEQLKWSYDQLRSTSKLNNGHAMNGEV